MLDQEGKPFSCGSLLPLRQLMDKGVEFELGITGLFCETLLDRLGVQDEEGELILRNGEVIGKVRYHSQVCVDQVIVINFKVLIANVVGRLRHGAQDAVLEAD